MARISKIKSKSKSKRKTKSKSRSKSKSTRSVSNYVSKKFIDEFPNELRQCRFQPKDRCLSFNENCVWNRSIGCVKRPNYENLNAPPYTPFVQAIQMIPESAEKVRELEAVIQKFKDGEIELNNKLNTCLSQMKSQDNNQALKDEIKTYITEIGRLKQVIAGMEGDCSSKIKDVTAKLTMEFEAEKAKIEQIRKDKEQGNLQIEKLKSERDTCNSKLDAVEANIKKINDKIQQLETASKLQIENLKSNMEKQFIEAQVKYGINIDIEGKTRDLTLILNELQSRYEDEFKATKWLQEKLINIVQEKNRKIEELGNIIEDNTNISEELEGHLQDDIKSKLLEIEQLKSQIEDNNKALQQRERQINDLKQDIENKLSSNIENNRKQKEETDKRISEIESKLAKEKSDLQRQLDIKIKEYTELSTEKSKIEIELNECKSKGLEMEQRLEQYESEIASLKAELSGLKGTSTEQVQKLTELVETEKRKCDDEKQQINEKFIKQIDNLNNQKSALERQIIDLNNIIDTKESQLKNSLEKYSETTNKLQECNNDKIKLDSEIKGLKSLQMSLENDISELKRQLLNTQGINDDLNEQIRQNERLKEQVVIDLQNKTKEIENLSENLKQLRVDIEKETNTIRRLSTDLKECNESEAQYKTKYNDLSNEITALQGKIQPLTIENEELNKTVKLQKQEIKKLLDEIRQLKIESVQIKKAAESQEIICKDDVDKYLDFYETYLQKYLVPLNKKLDQCYAKLIQLKVNENNRNLKEIEKYKLFLSEKHNSQFTTPKLRAIYDQIQTIRNNKYILSEVEYEYEDKICKDIKDALSHLTDNVIFIQNTVYKDIINLYEDITGAVRVFVRITKLLTEFPIVQTAPVYIDKKWFIQYINKQYGPFYDVFPETFTNCNVLTGIETTDDQCYNKGDFKLLQNGEQINEIKTTLDSENKPIHEGLYNSLVQVTSGYSIVIFGYGLSGSGKTYTLLGDQKKNEPGLIHLALANLPGQNKVTLKYVNEIAFGSWDTSTKAQSKVLDLNLIYYLDKPKFKYNNTIFEKIPTLNKDSINQINGVEASKKIYDITSAISRHRVTNKRLKFTPNNPESSRSHLFLTFEIKHVNNDDSETTGFLTFVDMGGRESPQSIFNQFFDNLSLGYVLTQKEILQKNIQKDLFTPIIDDKNPNIKIKLDYYTTQTPAQKGKNMYDAKTMIDIIKEGVFINETINHIKFFLQKKVKPQEKTPSLMDYDTLKQQWIIENEKIFNKYDSDKALMRLMLEWLDGLTPNPTKFIMMCLVRQEEKYKNDTMSTLDFAIDVASTQ